MKRIVLICGMILVLVCAMFILTGCETSTEKTDDTDNVVNTEEKAAETVNEYAYKELSFKLPSNFKETEGNNGDNAIYNTEIENDIMKMFSVGSFDAQGIEDYVGLASEALKEQEFALPGYDVTLKKDPEIVEYNGIRTISILIDYNGTTANGDAKIEYCYAQKGNTVYVICFEMFAQKEKKIEDTEFANTFDAVKSTLQFAE